MIEPTPEILRGHIDECLRHYAESLLKKAPKGSKEAPESRRQIAEYCGVAISTPSNWFAQSTLPTGQAFIRLLCFLDTLGYRVLELERIGHRMFAELIGYKIISVEEAVSMVGYSSPNKLLRVFWGDVRTSKEKATIMWDIAKNRKEELLKAKQQLRALLLEQQPAVEPQPTPATPPQPDQSRNESIALMDRLTSLLNDEALTEPEEPEEFVQQALNLSGRLIAVSSIILGRNKMGPP